MVRSVGVVVAALLLLGACSSTNEEKVIVEQEIDWPVFPFLHEPLEFNIGTPTEQQLVIAREADVPFDTWFLTATVAPPGSDANIGEIRVTDFIVGPDSYQEFEYIILNATDAEMVDASIGETDAGACNRVGLELIAVRSTQTGCVLGSTGEIVWHELGRTFSATVAPGAPITTGAIVDWLDSLVVTQLGQTGSPYNMPFCSDDPSGCTS